MEKDIRIISKKNIHPDYEETLRLMGMKKGFFEKEKKDFKETFASLYQKQERLLSISMKAKMAMTFSYLNGEEVIYAIYTLGDGIDKSIDRLNKREEVFESFILSTMADSALFVFKNEIKDNLLLFAAEKNKGIESLVSDNDMFERDIEGKNLLEKAYYLLEADRTLSARLNKSLIGPSKTLVEIYRLNNKPFTFNLEPACMTCQNHYCAAREDNKELITINAGENIAHFIHDNGYEIQMPCAGAGLCGKCKVRLVEGQLEATKEEKELLSQEEIEDGIRLACLSECKEKVKIEVISGIEDIHVDKNDLSTSKEDITLICDKTHTFSIAIDYGSTTLAATLVDLEDKKESISVSASNHQSNFGADVISRIKASNVSKKEEIKNISRKDIKVLIEKLLEKSKLSWSNIKKIVIAGNTTMINLFMGYDCDGLAKYPFNPKSLGGEILKAKEILELEENIETEIILMKGISSYVGADISSGLYYEDVLHKEENILFVDLGTNGEMAITRKDQIVVASTAAGPAFEGGNLSCGMPSISGAIESVVIKNEKVQVKTINNKEARGLCGSGVVESISQLILNGIIDRTGKLEDKYFEDGYKIADNIYISQEDIRQFQMAKAAIRAGIEALIKEANMTYEDFDKLIIAGGFGLHLKKEDLAIIGMIPSELENKCEMDGNTSIKGAIKLIKNENVEDIDFINKKAKELILANDDDFQDLYISYMNF